MTRWIMAIVTQTDKRTGITYAYEIQYFWDKEKQQSRAKCICVGKVDPITNENIPTRGRVKRKEESAKKIFQNVVQKPLERQNISIMVQHICLTGLLMNLDVPLT